MEHKEITGENNAKTMINMHIPEIYRRKYSQPSFYPSANVTSSSNWASFPADLPQVNLSPTNSRANTPTRPISIAPNPATEFLSLPRQNSTGITPSPSSSSFTEPGPVHGQGQIATSVTSGASLDFLVKNSSTVEAVLGPEIEAEAKSEVKSSDDGIGFEPIKQEVKAEVKDGEVTLKVNEKDGSVIKQGKRKCSMCYAEV